MDIDGTSGFIDRMSIFEERGTRAMDDRREASETTGHVPPRVLPW
ncbi:hypothetical protein ACFZBU_13765 [Embleya sp. NPDC008237]